MTDVSQLLNRVPASSSPRPATRSTCTWCWLRIWACPEPRDLIGYKQQAHPFSSPQVIIAQGSSKLTQDTGYQHRAHPVISPQVIIAQGSSKLTQNSGYQHQAHPFTSSKLTQYSGYQHQAHPFMSSKLNQNSGSGYQHHAHPFMSSKLTHFSPALTDTFSWCWG